MQRKFGTEFWNDSCDLSELSQAIQHGAVGATSNPVIAATAVAADPERWQPVLRSLLRERPDASEDAIAWALIAEVGRSAAALLEPVYRASEGRCGRLSLQVDPRLYRSREAMLLQGRELAQLAENVAVKVPATEAGIAAMEQLTSEGLAVNATLSFSLTQALAAGEAIERGLRRSATKPVGSYVTLMVGRLDDALKRSLGEGASSELTQACDWAGIAVAKRAYAEFRERGLQARLLIAAYRHLGHWTELVGEGLVQTLPYAWWKQAEASGLELRTSVGEAVDAELVKTLYAQFPDFRKAYEPDGVCMPELLRYAPAVHTLQQFLGGYQQLLGLIREVAW